MSGALFVAIVLCSIAAMGLTRRNRPAARMFVVLAMAAVLGLIAASPGYAGDCHRQGQVLRQQTIVKHHARQQLAVRSYSLPVQQQIVLPAPVVYQAPLVLEQRSASYQPAALQLNVGYADVQQQRLGLLGRRAERLRADPVVEKQVLKQKTRAVRLPRRG